MLVMKVGKQFGSSTGLGENKSRNSESVQRVKKGQRQYISK